MATFQNTDTERSEHYLVIGTAEGDGSMSRLKASGALYKVKRLRSGPENWNVITEMLADPRMRAVALKMTGNDYRLFLDRPYAAAALLDNLALKSNLVLVHESLLDGAATGEPEPAEPQTFAERLDLGLDETTPVEDLIMKYYPPIFHIPTDDVREAVHDMFYSRSIQIMPYRTNAQLSVLVSMFFDDCADNLLFRIYVPQGKLYAEEAGRILRLFRDWLTTVKSHRVREDGYSTQAGQVYEFYTDHDHDISLAQSEVGEFFDFLTKCSREPGEATSLVIDAGMDPGVAVQLVTKYGKEGRRIQLDVRQIREARVLSLKHAFESDLAEGHEAEFSQQINEIVESLVPDPGVAFGQLVSGSGLNVSANNITVNISHQSVSEAAHVIQNSIQGTSHLPPEAAKILELIDRFGQDDPIDAETLTTYVHELDDDDCRDDARMRAAKSLKGFLFRIAKEAESAVIQASLDYVERKFGF